MARTKSILAVYIEENFDVRGLIKAGFFQTKEPDLSNYIKNTKDYERIEARVKTFFGLKTIYDYSKIGQPKSEAEKSVEYIPCNEWLLSENRLLTLITNN